MDSTKTLRDLRRAKGLSQQELARRAGITQAHVSDLEKGKHSPGTKSLLGLARVLGMSAEDLAASLLPPP